MTMWSFFSSDPAKNFPFEVGEIVGGLESFSVWSLHNGKRKVSAALFSSHNRNPLSAARCIAGEKIALRYRILHMGSIRF